MVPLLGRLTVSNDVIKSVDVGDFVEGGIVEFCAVADEDNLAGAFKD